MTGKETKKLELMKSFAEVLNKKEMREKDCIKLLGMTQPNFRTFITSMSERFLIYEYKDNREIVYGILK